ncbi:MAG: glutamine amidotransferase [Chloroflexi bacterium]|nr:glutamine amidotransferase [Chloroflexota bacterium]
MSRPNGREPIRIVHLFPELLNLYGDRGNVATLTNRARWRGFAVEVEAIEASAAGRPIRADIIFIGGGPDRLQVGVARALARMEGSLARAVFDGAALLAVCGGFQNLGYQFRSSLAGSLSGPGLFDVSTDAPESTQRMVGGVVARLEDGSPIAAIGRASAAAAGFAGQEQTIVGFENHGGRTTLGARVRVLAQVDRGHGNNGVDGGEGVIALPGESGLAGLRIGTYLHGPLLPRNPHLADFILASVLRPRGISGLAELSDEAEWASHAAFAGRWGAGSGDRGTPPRPSSARARGRVRPRWPRPAVRLD